MYSLFIASAADRYGGTSMEILLIRHAHAGERQPGGSDRYRALSPEGFDQAQAMAQAMADRPVRSFLASPATRCVQTIEPSALSKAMEVEEREEFWEGSNIDDVMVLLDNLVRAAFNEAATTDAEPAAIVVCSHGDIIPEVVERLSHAGVEITGRGCERASTWILTHDGDDWQGARYLSRKESAIL